MTGSSGPFSRLRRTKEVTNPVGEDYPGLKRFGGVVFAFVFKVFGGKPVSDLEVSGQNTVYGSGVWV